MRSWYFRATVLLHDSERDAVYVCHTHPAEDFVGSILPPHVRSEWSGVSPECTKGNVGAGVCHQPEDILLSWLYLDQVLLGKAGRSETMGISPKERGTLLPSHFRSPMRTPRGVELGLPSLVCAFHAVTTSA